MDSVGTGHQCRLPGPRIEAEADSVESAVIQQDLTPIFLRMVINGHQFENAD